MVVVSYSGKEINAKLVYYGPGLSGKTTNLEYIYKSVPANNRGKMVSMKTRTERTLFFDFLPVDLGEMGGFKTRFLLYTVPGQVYYNATRKLVLRGVDALIFVADSERGKMDENLDSLQNLRENLKEYSMKLEELPWIIQYNKRDLPDVYSIEELEKALNPDKVPHYEAVAMTGDGVFETFRGVSRLVLQKLSKEVKLGEGRVTQKLAQAAPEASGDTPVAPAASRSSATVKMPSPVARKPAETPRPVAPAPAPEPSHHAPTYAEHTTPSHTEHTTPSYAEHTTPSYSEHTTPSYSEHTHPAATSEHSAPVAHGATSSEPNVTPSYRSRWDEPQPGFWSRLFGRGKSSPTPLPEPRVASVSLARVGGSGAVEPVVIEKRVSVPVTLGPEEVLRGAKLRLVIEVQVDTSSSETSKVA